MEQKPVFPIFKIQFSKKKIKLKRWKAFFLFDQMVLRLPSKKKAEIAFSFLC